MLGTHPAFRWDVAALVCPTAGCDTEPFTRVAEYNRHFLDHQPTAEQAFRWLSGHEYDRQAPRRGWPSGEEMLARHPDGPP
jgi:hypothetical protein